MEIMRSYAIQPWFKASFSTSNVAQNRARWNKIGRIFKEATKDMPNDKLVLSCTEKKGLIPTQFFLTLKKADNKLDRLDLNRLGDWLLAESDEKISQRFVKLLKGMKIRHKAMQDYYIARHSKQNNKAAKLVTDNYVKDIFVLSLVDDNPNLYDDDIFYAFGGNYVSSRFVEDYDERKFYLKPKGKLPEFRENFETMKTKITFY